MVSQTLVSPSAVRQQLLGADGKFLLLYGCQVDWDTNVIIEHGASVRTSRRCRSCLNACPLFLVPDS